MTVPEGWTVVRFNGVKIDTALTLANADEPPRIQAKYESSFTVTFEAAEADRLREFLVELWYSGSRYWRRRRVRQVKRWRERVARRSGLSYQAFRHFCRTGRLD